MVLIENDKNLSKNCLEIKYIKDIIAEAVITPEKYNIFSFKPNILNKKALYRYEKGP